MSDNKDFTPNTERDLTTLNNPELAQAWVLSTWLGYPDTLRIKLSENGPGHISSSELSNLNLLTPQIGPKEDFILSLSRNDPSQSSFSTSHGNKNILQVNGNLQTYRGRIESDFDSKKVVPAVKPILEKILPIAKTRLAESLRKTNQPNRMLSRTFFTTNDPNTYWLELDSLCSDLDNEDTNNPLRRLYINTIFKNLSEYTNFMNSLVRSIRQYPEALHFKALYSGNTLEQQVQNPDFSKIVFYFNNNEKEKGLQLLRWLEKQEQIKQLSVGNLHNIPGTTIEGSISKDSKLIFAKGTREDRRFIVDRLQRGENTDTLHKQAQLRSIKV